MTESSLAPVSSVAVTNSSITRMMSGTPAMTMTLPMRKPGASEIGFGINDAPSGNPSHAQARGRQLKASAGVVFGKRFFRPWIDADRNTEGLGDTVGGNIIMRRADATGRENIVVAGPERVYSVDNLAFVIGDHPNFLQPYADARQMLGDRAGVAVFRAT